jgi:hypothetical protein
MVLDPLALSIRFINNPRYAFVLMANLLYAVISS